MNFEAVLAMQAEIDQLKSERNEAKTEVERLTAELKDARDTRDYYQRDQDRHLDEAQRQWIRTQTAESEVERLTESLAAVAEESAERKTQRDEARDEVEQLTRTAEALRVNRNQLKDKLTQADALIAELRRAT